MSYCTNYSPFGSQKPNYVLEIQFFKNSQRQLYFAKHYEILIMYISKHDKYSDFRSLIIMMILFFKTNTYMSS
jgi:hypothetical protein